MKSATTITQAELARYLGIHQTTVSAILDGKRAERYSDAMRRRVHEAAQRLGYRPSAPARVLRGARSGLIGVFHFGRDKEIESDRLHEVVAAIHDCEYLPLAMPMASKVMWVEKDAGSACSVMLDARVEALVLSGFSDDFDLGQLERFAAAGIPIAGVSGVKLPGVPLYATDRDQAAYDATAHLIEGGCGKLACLSRRPSRLNHLPGARANPVLDGFHRAIQTHGLKPEAAIPLVEPSPLATGLNAFQSGEKVFGGIWESGLRPDGVVCYDDGWAVGVYSYCQRNGIRIPGDLAVIGFENQDVCEYMVPSLSSVSVPHRAMARQAMDDLHGRLLGKTISADPGGRLFPGTLVVRESSVE